MAEERTSTARSLLVVAATGMEVRGLVDVRLMDAELARGRWAMVEVRPGLHVAVSGLGRANAAGATAAVLANGQFETVLSVGVCGSLPDGRCAVGDVIVAGESVFVEEGIELPEGAADMHRLGFALYPGEACDGNVMVSDAALVEELTGVLGGGVKVGRIATVARCSGSDGAARRVVAQTGAIAEAMEGAAVVLAARRMGVVRAGEVRVVSNRCGDREGQVWDLERALVGLEEVLDCVSSKSLGQ